MKNYKKTLIIVSGICLLLGTGCINENLEGEKIGEEVLRCLNDDDTQGLKDLFCAESQTSKDLDNQIQAGMDFFVGKVNIDSLYDPSVGGGESVTGGETVEENYDIDYYELKTDTGKTYRILCEGYFINKEDPDKVGALEIDIIDEDGNRCKIGDCDWIR